MRIDAHFGTLEDYRALSRCLHARNMALVQDIVVNHVGNFFRYDGAVDARRSRRATSTINGDAKPHSAPTQFPFSLNDVRARRIAKAAIYHWTPRIIDFGNRAQELRLAAGRPRRPEHRKSARTHAHCARLRLLDPRSRRRWLRVDTAFYVPPDFFDDFLHADDPHAPGILRAARASGRENFLLFGEGFGMDPPYTEAVARRIDTYMRDATGKPLLPAMINFPLYGSTLDVFARGRPSAVLGHRIRSMMRVHANPYLMPSFVDNHDVDRFLASGSEAGLRQSLLLIMALPGIPVIYYGTEQGFTATARGNVQGWLRCRRARPFRSQCSHVWLYPETDCTAPQPPRALAWRTEGARGKRCRSRRAGLVDERRCADADRRAQFGRSRNPARRSRQRICCRNAPASAVLDRRQS